MDLNRYIVDVTCPLPTRQELLRLVKLGKYAGTIDIQSCYTNILLHESARPYCCIFWEGRFYQFTRVPFGIKCAPACCQELTRAFCDTTLEIVYLDDFLLVDGLSENLKIRLKNMKQSLESKGLPVNVKKSVLLPSTTVYYAGYKLDFEKGTVNVQEKSLQKLIVCINNIKNNGGADIKEWRSFMGVFEWCRSRKEDKCVMQKLGEMLQCCEKQNGCFIHVSESDMEVISDIPRRCSLPFDH